MHVRFVGGPSGGPGGSSFPEILEAAAELAAPQGDDGVGAGHGPVHAGALEPGADGELASGLDDARRHAKTPRPELRIAHPVAVAGQVVDTLAGLLAGLAVGAQFSQDRIEPPGVQLVPPVLAPPDGQVRAGAVDGLGDITQMPLGVVDVDDFDGAGELFGGQIPDPLGPVADDDASRRGVEAAPPRFAIRPLRERGRQRVGGAAGRALDRGAVADRPGVAFGAKLQAVGFIGQGSVQTRRIACGSPTCRCHHDPDARHGPYHYWTRKARGKTVGLKLTEDELGLYREWIENNRELERLVEEMRRISSRVLALITGRQAP